MIETELEELKKIVTEGGEPCEFHEKESPEGMKISVSGCADCLIAVLEKGGFCIIKKK